MASSGGAVQTVQIEAERVYREIVQLLQSELSMVSNLVFDRLASRLPLMAVPDDLVAEIRSALHETTGLGLAELASDSEWTALSDRLAQVAAKRASQGIALGQSLLAYEIGTQVIFEEIVKRLPDDDRIRSDVLAYACVQTMEYLQVATLAVATGYQAVTTAAALDREHQLQVYLEVVVGRRTDISVSALAVPSGIDTPFRWCVVTSPQSEGLARSLRHVRQLHGGSLVGRVDDRITVLSATRPRIDDLDVVYGVAPITDERPPAAALHDAIGAADVAAHLHRPWFDAAEAAPLAALLSLEAYERTAFLQSRLGPLLTDAKGVELLRTLRAYIASGFSVRAASDQLHIHRHTLEYRLQRIQELTALDPKAPFDRFTAEVALFLLGEFDLSP